MIANREPRLVIAQRPVRRDHLHGAWWPRTTDLEPELAPVLEVVSSRFGAVLGVMLNGDDWPETLVHRRPVRLGKAKISWYGLPESHLVVLHCGGAVRLSILLLAPATPEKVALTATLLAAAPGNGLTTEQTLVRACLRPDEAAAAATTAE